MCKYWHRDERVKDKSEYAYLKSPDGYFQARELMASTLQNSQIGGMFMFDENTLMLRTTDENSVRVNDVVEYEGELFIATNVQDRVRYKQTQFLKKSGRTTYIQLRR